MNDEVMWKEENGEGAAGVQEGHNSKGTAGRRKDNQDMKTEGGANK